ncbi:MAG: bile acid:sodium symporter [Alcaligenaceae bacterium]|nr:bile acid:sodium symporter [Alcaligenaceae bacterium]
MAANIARFIPDRFTTLLVLAVVLATLLPVHGNGVPVMEWVTNIGIAMLFFLHGSRLSRDAIIAGAMHWRLHIAIFSTTFIFFPLIGIALRPVLEPMVTPGLYLGILYLCVLPATVQSAISFTSIARGNIAAAVCSASASSIIGIFVTPLLIALLLSEFSSDLPPISFEAIWKIMLQLLFPFALGHFMRPWLGNFLLKNAAILKFFDQGIIILVVYAAFSHAVNEGLWHETPVHALIMVTLISCLILAIALGSTLLLGKIFKFDIKDRITLMFCGSKKSLASGLPMAQVIFAGSPIGAIILPLMIFHQIQLMVCAVIATRFGQRTGD